MINDNRPREYGAGPGPVRITVAKIQRLVADYYNIRVEDLTGRTRERICSYPRMMAMFLAREITRKSSTEIGMRFHRDHSTVLYAERQIKEKRRADPVCQQEIEEITRLIKEIENSDKNQVNHPQPIEYETTQRIESQLTQLHQKIDRIENIIKQWQ